MIPAREALARLRDGNRRFASDTRSHGALTSQARRDEADRRARSRSPSSSGCSDSRVPAELVFDQGLGDLFVIRVAGNIVAPSQVGSVEFAADALLDPARGGARALAVRGHPGHARGTAAADRPPVPEHPLHRGPGASRRWSRCSPPTCGTTPTALVREAIRANIRASVDQLRHGSEVLEQLIADEGLLIVGAEYSLETGVVDFLDGTPTARP